MVARRKRRGSSGRRSGRTSSRRASKKKRGSRRASAAAARVVSRPRTVKKVSRQVGSSVREIDRRYKALPPGKRISRFGKVYWETRKNRSDLEGNV